MQSYLNRSLNWRLKISSTIQSKINSNASMYIKCDFKKNRRKSITILKHVENWWWMSSCLKKIEKKILFYFHSDLFEFRFIFHTICKRKQEKRFWNCFTSNWKKWNRTIYILFFSKFIRRKNEILNYKIENKRFNLNIDQTFTILRRRVFYDDNRLYRFQIRSAD